MRAPRSVDPASMQLAELLDFRPDQGTIRLHEQRVVILSAAAMGLLRKELIDTFGVDVAFSGSVLTFRNFSARGLTPGPTKMSECKT